MVEKAAIHGFVESQAFRQYMQSVEAATQALRTPVLEAARQAAEIGPTIHRSLRPTMEAIESMTPAFRAMEAWQHQLGETVASIHRSIDWTVFHSIKHFADSMEQFRVSVPKDLLDAIAATQHWHDQVSSLPAAGNPSLPRDVGGAIWAAWNAVDQAIDWADGLDIDRMLMSLALALVLWPLFLRRTSAAA